MDFDGQVRRARAAVTRAVELHLRAAHAVADALTTVTATATRYGDLLQSHDALVDTGDSADLETRAVLTRVFTAAGVSPVRQLVKHVAGRAGLPDDDLDDFALAVQELMTNAIRHGGGWGRVRLRREGDLLICAVADRGPGFTRDPLSHVRLPPTDSIGGRGLFLARQTTHNLRISTGHAGVTVTVTMNLTRPDA